MNPKFPVYIISKGRWESRLTAKTLEHMKIPYFIVIEPQEYEQYSSVIHPSKIKVLPFSNLGQGSIPARNWVWQDSIEQGFEWHWILDDNIRDFYRLNRNIKYRVDSGNIFACIEDFVCRFSNIAQAGMQYELLMPRKAKMKPFILNTRIYSCILIRNDLPFRWRGHFNEDTDLSLRCLKSGWCTILFNAFLCGKEATMTMKGGNTDELYARTNDRYEFAKSLKDQHPDVVEIVRKYGRWHHKVNYKPFKGNKLRLKPGHSLPTESNEYGMKFVKL